MKQFWGAFHDGMNACALIVGHVVLPAAGVVTFLCLVSVALDAVNDYLRGRAIRKGSK